MQKYLILTIFTIFWGLIGIIFSNFDNHPLTHFIGWVGGAISMGLMYLLDKREE